MRISLSHRLLSIERVHQIVMKIKTRKIPMTKTQVMMAVMIAPPLMRAAVKMRIQMRSQRRRQLQRRQRRILLLMAVAPVAHLVLVVIAARVIATQMRKKKHKAVMKTLMKVALSSLANFQRNMHFWLCLVKR